MFYYSFAWAIGMLLLERDDSNTPLLGNGRVALISFLWLSCGFGILFFPLLIFLFILYRRPGYLVLIATLAGVTALNLSNAVLYPPESEYHVHVALDFRLFRVYAGNLFLRLVVLPFFGAPAAELISTFKPGAYWGVIAAAAAALLYAFQQAGLPARDRALVAALVLSLFVSIPLGCIARPHGFGVYEPPVFNAASRYALLGSLSAIWIWTIILSNMPSFRARSRLFGTLLLCIVLNASLADLYAPPADGEEIHREWVAGAEKIEAALQERSAGRQPAEIPLIRLRPAGWMVVGFRNWILRPRA